MILKSIALTPFGGLTDAQLDFKSGLNVIHGPNEAGKSTIFNALQRVLFTPTHLTSAVFKREMKSFLPLEGGDTIVVSLCLDLNGDTYVLKKIWGATRSAELTLPGGSIITDEDAVQKRLISLLPAKEGTFKTVLMTYQSGLPKTIEELEDESIQTLSTILRRAVFETDGVSVDQFKQNIESEYTAYYSRWDRERRRPESDRRYIRDVGNILQAYYVLEDIRTALKEARSYEAELDEINSEINTCSDTIETLEAYIKKNKRVVEDARQRQLLNNRLDAINVHMEIHQKDSRDWPVAESEVSRIEALFPGLEQKENALALEQEMAIKKEERIHLRRQFEQVKERRQELKDAEQAAQQTPKLTANDLEELRNTYAKLNQLKASVTASKLSVRLLAKNALSVLVQEGLSEPQSREIGSGEHISYDEGGRVKISHHDWEIDISSGESNFDALVQEFEKTNRHLTALLEQHGVENLNEAIEVNNNYTNSLQSVNSAKNNLEAALAGETYEELKAKVAEIGTTEDSRDLDSILEELQNVRDEISGHKRSLEQHKERIQELINTYGSFDQLLLNLAEEARREREMQKEIENLVPLPDGVDDIDSFIEMYEEKRAELTETNDHNRDLLIQRAKIKKNEPELFAEELDNRLVELNENFKRINKRGEAVARIKELTDQLMEEMDSNTYKGLTSDLERYVVSMTENRYAQIDMDESMPRGFVRQDGVTLPYDLLSAGTKDVLALSLRLAMANHFLRDANGMLMLDDPLVDLDPRRQEKAAEAFRDFAEQKQMIIFTCHPHHAELLGGHQIELDLK